MKIVQDSSAHKQNKKKYKKYAIKNEQLYKLSRVNNQRFPLVIPESVVNYELEEAHDKPTAYHFGVKRTLDTIRKRFY